MTIDELFGITSGNAVLEIGNIDSIVLEYVNLGASEIFNSLDEFIYSAQNDFENGDQMLFWEVLRVRFDNNIVYIEID